MSHDAARKCDSAPADAPDDHGSESDLAGGLDVSYAYDTVTIASSTVIN